MSHAAGITEIVLVNDDWLVTVAGIEHDSALAADIFPSGLPYGVTVATQSVVHEPELSGTFVIAGLSAAAVPHLAPEYAERFRAAGLIQLLLNEPPPAGWIRTWIRQDDGIPWDVPWDEALRLHVDSWISASHGPWPERMSELAVTFRYENGRHHSMWLAQARVEFTEATRLLNDGATLIVPTDENFEPVLNLRTCPRMTQLRRDLDQAALRREAWGADESYLDGEFARSVEALSRTRWTHPDDAFPDPLGRR